MPSSSGWTEEAFSSSMPPGGMEEVPHEEAPCRDCKDASHWIIDIHEGMEEAAHLFLVLLLHAAWRHGGGEDGYC